MSTHTPGPWAINGNTIEWPFDGEIVATITDYADMTPRQAANARLIAAAPDLVGHLARLLSAIDRLPGNNPLEGLADEARAVIRKATGN